MKIMQFWPRFNFYYIFSIDALRNSWKCDVIQQIKKSWPKLQYCMAAQLFLLKIYCRRDTFLQMFCSKFLFFQPDRFCIDYAWNSGGSIQFCKMWNCSLSCYWELDQTSICSHAVEYSSGVSQQSSRGVKLLHLTCIHYQDPKKE